QRDCSGQWRARRRRTFSGGTCPPLGWQHLRTRRCSLISMERCSPVPWPRQSAVVEIALDLQHWRLGSTSLRLVAPDRDSASRGAAARTSDRDCRTGGNAVHIDTPGGNVAIGPAHPPEFRPFRWKGRREKTHRPIQGRSLEPYVS